MFDTQMMCCIFAFHIKLWFQRAKVESKYYFDSANMVNF